MGKFIIKQTETGFVFHLKASNGEVIATSQVYTSEQACIGGIQSVMANADAHIEDQTVSGYQTLTHPKYEIYNDKAGEFRFRLKAKNGEAIAASEGYTTKANCQNGIASIVKNAPDATIERE